ncbi:hypothetical protein MDOR_19620 [Mycolicibacterium doricum]|uniref:Uncharacterized protein n=1 Tax=Mycolicibacterium doricum TaxID=126673 RepID=A0A1X1SY02_9MYCO|nr:hypothetical protein AWC01_00570 [Mycolicibacterium doricum]BBZ07793.1 hypothetical protein MDOR_19620 [Mycolicibacterium doricum]
MQHVAYSKMATEMPLCRKRRTVVVDVYLRRADPTAVPHAHKADGRERSSCVLAVAATFTEGPFSDLLVQNMCGRAEGIRWQITQITPGLQAIGTEPAL